MFHSYGTTTDGARATAETLSAAAATAAAAVLRVGVHISACLDVPQMCHSYRSPQTGHVQSVSCLWLRLVHASCCGAVPVCIVLSTVHFPALYCFDLRVLFVLCLLAKHRAWGRRVIVRHRAYVCCMALIIVLTKPVQGCDSICWVSDVHWWAGNLLC
jgi:hypothetical protein